MNIVKKTDEYIVVKSPHGSYLKLNINKIDSLVHKLSAVQNIANGVVDGRRGECLTDGNRSKKEE